MTPFPGQSGPHPDIQGGGLLLAHLFAPDLPVTCPLAAPRPQPLALPRTDLEPAGQELVLHLQVVALVDLGLEGLVEDHVSRVVLYVLPTGIAVPGWGTVKGKPGHGVGGGRPAWGLAPRLCALQIVINLGCKMSTWTRET